MNDIFVRKSDSSSREDQTQVDSTSESKNNEPITSDADCCLIEASPHSGIKSVNRKNPEPGI